MTEIKFTQGKKGSLNDKLDAIAKQARVHEQSLAEGFSFDRKRAEHLSVVWDDLLFDFSKQKVDQGILESLWLLAQEQGLTDKRADLLAGRYWNVSENRAVFHTLKNENDAHEKIKVYGAANCLWPEASRDRYEGG